MTEIRFTEIQIVGEAPVDDALTEAKANVEAADDLPGDLGVGNVVPLDEVALEPEETNIDESSVILKEVAALPALLAFVVVNDSTESRGGQAAEPEAVLLSNAPDVPESDAQTATDSGGAGQPPTELPPLGGYKPEPEPEEPEPADDKGVSVGTRERPSIVEPPETEEDDEPPKELAGEIAETFTPEQKLESDLLDAFERPGDNELFREDTLRGCTTALEQYFLESEDLDEEAAAAALEKLPRDCLYPIVNTISQGETQPAVVVGVARKVASQDPEQASGGADSRQVKDLRHRYAREQVEVEYHKDFAALKEVVDKRRAQMDEDLRMWQEIPAQPQGERRRMNEHIPALTEIVADVAKDMKGLGVHQTHLAKLYDEDRDGSRGWDVDQEVMVPRAEQRQRQIAENLRNDIFFVASAHPNTLYAVLEASLDEADAAKSDKLKLKVEMAHAFMVQFERMKGFRDPGFRRVIDGARITGNEGDTAAEAFDNSTLYPGTTAVSGLMLIYAKAMNTNAASVVGISEIYRACTRVALVALFGDR